MAATGGHTPTIPSNVFATLPDWSARGPRRNNLAGGGFSHLKGDGRAQQLAGRGKGAGGVRQSRATAAAAAAAARTREVEERALIEEPVLPAADAEPWWVYLDRLQAGGADAERARRARTEAGRPPPREMCDTPDSLNTPPMSPPQSPSPSPRAQSPGKLHRVELDSSAQPTFLTATEDSSQLIGGLMEAEWSSVPNLAEPECPPRPSRARRIPEVQEAAARPQPAPPPPTPARPPPPQPRPPSAYTQYTADVKRKLRDRLSPPRRHHVDDAPVLAPAPAAPPVATAPATPPAVAVAAGTCDENPINTGRLKQKTLELDEQRPRSTARGWADRPRLSVSQRRARQRQVSVIEPQMQRPASGWGWGARAPTEQLVAMSCSLPLLGKKSAEAIIDARGGSEGGVAAEPRPQPRPRPATAAPAVTGGGGGNGARLRRLSSATQTQLGQSW